MVEVPINQVKLWAENPRKNETAVPKLAELFKTRPQVTPVVVWPKNGVCYKGNTTIKALKLIGKTMVKVLYYDFPSEAAAIAYGIADNKSSEWSQWDDSILSEFMKVDEIKNTSAFTEKELGFFSTIDVKIETVSIIEKLFRAFKMFKDSSLNILNYVLINEGRIRFTNLDITVDAPMEIDDDGIYDFNQYEYIHDFKYCKTDLNVEDFPSLPDAKFKKIDINISNLEKFIPFVYTDTTREVLCNVNFTKDNIFSTDGHLGLIQNKENKIELSLTPLFIKVLSCFDKQVEVFISDEIIKVITQDGVTIYGKIGKYQIPVIQKVIEKIDSFVEIDKKCLIQQLKKVLPLSNKKTFRVDLFKEKVSTEKVSAEIPNIGFETSVNVSNLIIALSAFEDDTVKIGIANNQIQIINDDSTAVVMTLRKIESFNSPVIFNIEKEHDEIIKKFSLRGHDFVINCSCLKGIEKKVKSKFNEIGFIS
jgi:hypothetical protein